MSDLYHCITKFVNDAITRLCPGQRLGVIVRYNYSDHNDITSRIFFSSDNPVDLNSTIEYSTDVIKHFNIGEDYSNLMHSNGLQTLHIPFDTNFHTKIHVWDRVQ
jgi:hypothetical protein